MANQAKPTRRSKSSEQTKDRKGGLTAAGRKHFKETEGAQLKPGVKVVKSAEDAKRKGSFLRRHYGKKSPSPLKDADGQPTRYALQAHAWGEPVPKTAADVKRLAAKGTKLLERYHQEADEKPKRSPATTRTPTAAQARSSTPRRSKSAGK